jgi:hypothetical protein
MDIPGWNDDIQAKLLAYVKAHPDWSDTEPFYTIIVDNDAMHEFMPEFKDFVKPYTVRFFGFLVLTKDVNVIHVDSDTSDCRFLFPILNCEVSETRYYRLLRPTNPDMQVLPDGEPFQIINPDDCEYVDKYVMTQPLIIRVREPHMIYGCSKLPRISLLVGVEEKEIDNELA